MDALFQDTQECFSTHIINLCFIFLKISLVVPELVRFSSSLNCSVSTSDKRFIFFWYSGYFFLIYRHWMGMCFLFCLLVIISNMTMVSWRLLHFFCSSIFFTSSLVRFHFAFKFENNSLVFWLCVMVSTFHFSIYFVIIWF